MPPPWSGWARIFRLTPPGGRAVHYYFPLDAEYVLRIRTRDSNANGPADDEDKPLEVRLPIKAGPHTVGVTFPAKSWEPENVPSLGGRRRAGRQRGRNHLQCRSIYVWMERG